MSHGRASNKQRDLEHLPVDIQNRCVVSQCMSRRAANDSVSMTGFAEELLLVQKCPVDRVCISLMTRYRWNFSVQALFCCMFLRRCSG